ncbi:MAG TPA: hypothetical protein VGY52_16870 [Roseiarcus sp.]|jgi:hypothetical protein|nr:hypothetical protein [Roseiarcus sp.]
MMAQAAARETIALRPAKVVMQLERMGAFHQTRLSFLRALLRRMSARKWRVARQRFDIDGLGVGTAIYSVQAETRRYSLVAFGHQLAPEKRTDRVIAEEWDATFVLCDGTPDELALERLRSNVPLQEAGRYLASELVLARANRSVRLFDQVVAALAAGRQPDAAAVEATGYLMRTTAVYGNGKFGIADRDLLKDRPELSAPFRAEMLIVYLIRSFTLDLVEHLAMLTGGKNAVRLDPGLRRRFGIGNATGLGMAPFLVKHPALIDRWMSARETALARVRNLDRADGEAVALFRTALAKSHRLLANWLTDDAIQMPRIERLRRDLVDLDRFAGASVLSGDRPFDALYRFAESNLSLEAQEYVVTLIIEPHGALVDELAEHMGIDEATCFRIDGSMRCGDLKALIQTHYDFALSVDFEKEDARARFWYVSEEKLEPRLGERFKEPGMEREQPLAVARDIHSLARALDEEAPETRLAAFLLARPEHRHAARRVQIAARHPYSEIRDNLIGADLRPIDILRCKLAFFGATRFDPRSDKWLRITLFQGAPFPDELQGEGLALWAYGG